MVVLQQVARAAAPVTGKARARAGFFVLVACAALALGGCVSLPQSQALRAAPPPGLAPRVELGAVPFHVQEDFLCGPAALAMVFNAAGAPGDVASLTPQVYLPGRKGSLQAEMLGATRRNGLVAWRVAPRLDSLLAEIAAGNPAVVLLNLGPRLFPVWHYAVVVGYDLEAGEVFLRSGRRERVAYPLGFFEFLWQDAGHWAMLALAPGRVPATAGEADFAAAVAALERVGRLQEARAAYRALLERWPDSLTGLIGLGNTEYALGDPAAAERAFRRAVAAHPGVAPAHNNLAHALAALGRMEEAEAAARRAVALGGPMLAEAEKTLQVILARRAAAPAVRGTTP